MREACLADADAMAAIHAQAFEHPWSRDSLEALLDETGGGGVVSGLDGFILWRTVGDEAEILTLAVTPAARRRGLGRALLGEACRHAARAGATTMFLEVADRNDAAVALYETAGFARAGLRRGYYASVSPPQDALVMRLALTAPTTPPITTV